jgi:hypothetical protein
MNNITHGYSGVKSLISGRSAMHGGNCKVVMFFMGSCNHGY